MKFLKKNWGNVLIIILLALLFIPQTGMPMKVYFNRLLAFSPSEIKEASRETLTDYNWQLSSLNATTKDFTASEGNVVVINLWATWCPPCVAEMPSLQKLYDAYGDRVDFYFVSTERKETLEKFLLKKGYELPIYRPLGKAPNQLDTNSLPTTYVLSKSGEIVMNRSGAADWNSDKVHAVLDGLLAE